MGSNWRWFGPPDEGRACRRRPGRSLRSAHRSPRQRPREDQWVGSTVGTEREPERYRTRCREESPADASRREPPSNPLLTAGVRWGGTSGEALFELETNSRRITPKHHGKPAIIRDQRTRPVNKIDNLAKSAKPPSPVQIRAAPPISGANSAIPRSKKHRGATSIVLRDLLGFGGRSARRSPKYQS